MTVQCDCSSTDNGIGVTKSTGDTCPSCGQKGKEVGRSTLRKLVKPEIEIPNDQTPVFYCPNSEDSLMYFWEDGSLCIDKNDLNVRVGFKELEAPRLACYCFNHTREEIEEEYEELGESKIETSIREKVAKGVCQCHLTNPTGRCCLPDIRGIIKSFDLGVSV